MMQLIIHARRSVEELVRRYHGGGNWGNGPAGYCGIASRFLINLARRNGIYNIRLICGTFDGMTHCWIEDGAFCIDLTIAQFKGFESKVYRICMIDSDFYRSHYVPEMSGSLAVKYQKQWEHGQNYESYSGILWKIHKKNYIMEYNGLAFK